MIFGLLQHLNFWTQLPCAVRKLCILLISIMVILIVFISPTASPALQENETATKFVWGLGFLICGTVFFGRKMIGITLPRNIPRKFSYLLIPLIATLLLNAVGTSLDHISLSNLNLLFLLSTGFWEEVFFRGLLFALWVKLFGQMMIRSRIGYTVLVSGIVFAIFHGNEQGTELFLLRCGLGIIYAMVMWKTNTILPLILLHGLNNGLAALMGGNLDQSIKILGIGFLSLLSLFLIIRDTQYARGVVSQQEISTPLSTPSSEG